MPEQRNGNRPPTILVVCSARVAVRWRSRFGDRVWVLHPAEEKQFYGLEPDLVVLECPREKVNPWMLQYLQERAKMILEARYV